MKQQDLVGHWTFSRKIFDGEYRQHIGNIWGRVTYEIIGKNKLLHQETILHLSGESSQFLAKQTYLYLFKEKVVEIHQHGKQQEFPFLKIPYGKLVVDGYYLCKPDIYQLRWVWVNSRLFYTRFCIKGMRKNHILESIFRR